MASSFLTNFLANPGLPRAFGNLLGGQQSGGQSAMDPFTAALQASVQAQKDANAIAASASVPQQDSESARSAADAQRRRLMQGSNFGIGMPAELGAPPVGYRMLSGQ